MYHRKQFILTKDSFHPDKFFSIKLSDGYNLSYHEDLPVIVSNNKAIIVLGQVWQTDCRRRDVMDEVEILSQKRGSSFSVDENDIIEMEKSWCGAYVIIADGKVYTDATAMRSVYYTAEAVAGCVPLLLDYEGKEIRKSIDYTMVLQGQGETFDFFPGPLTNVDGIKHLMPSQVLDYHNKAVHFRPLFTDDYGDLNTEQLSEKLISIFKYSIKKMRNILKGTFWLALTGGHDSRTTLALLSAAGIDFNCVTLERGLWAVYGVEDLYLPPLLASKAGKRHLLLNKKKSAYDEGKKRALLEATMYNVTGNAIDDYSYGQYDELRSYSKGDIVWIGSGIWEIYEDNFKYVNPWFKTGNESIDEFLEANKGRITSEKICLSLKEYFSWVDKNPQRGIDKVDRFYWEQGCAVWNAPYDQAKEMVEGFTMVQPLNCRNLLNILFALPEEMRIQRKFEEYLTIKLCPQFQGIGYSGVFNKKMLYFPYYFFEIGDSVVIYGAGKLGQQFIQRIQNDGLLVIAAVVDIEANTIKMCSGMPVIEPHKLKNISFDVVVITIMNSTESRRVRKKLINMGVPAYKIKTILPVLEE